MRLNADFSARAAVHAARIRWEPSPMAGVERRMLDRVGEEVQRATSVVRYAPDSQPHNAVVRPSPYDPSSRRVY